MLRGLRGAMIWSEDLDHLLPFYRALLGLPVAIQIPGFVVLGPAGAPTLALGTHSAVRGPNADPARPMVGLTSDDVDTDWKRRRRVRREPHGLRPASHGALKDLEGNLIQLLQPISG